MTGTQVRALLVALDGLRESGFDEETLTRMQWAIDPDFVRDIALRTAVRVRDYMTGVAANHAVEAGEAVSMQAFGWLTDLHRALLAVDVTPFLPPETPAGASTPQPPTGTDHLHEAGCYARPFPEGRAGTCSCRIGTPPAESPSHGPNSSPRSPPKG